MIEFSHFKTIYEFILKSNPNLPYFTLGGKSRFPILNNKEELSNLPNQLENYSEKIPNDFLQKIFGFNDSVVYVKKKKIDAIAII